MPRRLVPQEVTEAGGEHVWQRHAETLPESEIGRPTSRKTSIRLTWAEDEELGLFFRCRRCPEGLDRYYVELGRPVPTARLLARAADHFEKEHQRVLAPGQVRHENNAPQEPLAIFIPMQVQSGAGIICQLCPQGMNHVYLTTEPYGDARRIKMLLRERQDLREATKRFSDRERAEYVEARDRGDLQLSDRLAGRRALARAAATSAELDPRRQALADLLSLRAPSGRGIRQVIDQLATLSIRDPVRFSCDLAAAVPGLAQLAPDQPTKEFAAAVAANLRCAEGTFPHTTQTELWELWNVVRPV